MIEVIGVKFATNPSKIIYYSPNKERFEIGDSVIAEAPRGVEMGEVVIANKMIEQPRSKTPIPPIVRRANDKDFKTVAENEEKSKEAAKICSDKARLHGLDMHVLSAHYLFDGSKIIFYFTADGRVDFRDLVKTLASIFHSRIELRQIGVRDEAKMLGGLGVCGRPFCCSSFLNDFASISVKNAKEQGLSLNPGKISGCCGRLMCCLKYEEEAYEELRAAMPGFGAIVSPKEGALAGKKGIVENMFVVRGLLKIKFEELGEVQIIKANEVNVLKKGSWRASSGDESSVDENELKALE